jgi:hypothetical protein
MKLTATATGGTTSSYNIKQHVFGSFLFTVYYPQASESHFRNWKEPIDESRTKFSEVRRWARNIDSISSYKRFFFPCHIASIPHWVLLKLDIEHRTIHYYDSLYYEPRASFYCRLLQSYLSKAFTEVAGWTFKHQYHATVPQQKNCVDCGVYLLAFLECLYYTDSIPSQFSREDALNFRRYIALKFVEYGNNRGVTTELVGHQLPWPILLENKGNLDSSAVMPKITHDGRDDDMNAKMMEVVVDPPDETFEESDNLLESKKSAKNSVDDDAPASKKRSYQQFLKRYIKLPEVQIMTSTASKQQHDQEGGAEEASLSQTSLKENNHQVKRPKKGILNRSIPVTNPVVEKQAECLLQALREKYKNIKFLRQDVFYPRNLFTILNSLSLDNELKLVNIPADGNCYFTSTLMIIQEAQLRPRNGPGDSDIIQDADALRFYVVQKVLAEEDYVTKLLQRRYVASYELTQLEPDIHAAEKKREEYEKVLKDPKVPVEIRTLSMEYPELQPILDMDITKDSLDPLFACLLSEAYWADEIMINMVESNFFEGRFVRMKINSPSKDTPNFWWPYEVNSADIVGGDAPLKLTTTSSKEDDGDINKKEGEISVKTTTDDGRRIPRYPEGIILHYDRVHFEIVQQAGKCIVDLRNRSIVHDLFNLTVFNDDDEK